MEIKFIFLGVLILLFHQYNLIAKTYFFNKLLLSFYNFDKQQSSYVKRKAECCSFKTRGRAPQISVSSLFKNSILRITECPKKDTYVIFAQLWIIFLLQSFLKFFVKTNFKNILFSIMTCRCCHFKIILKENDFKKHSNMLYTKNII